MTKGKTMKFAMRGGAAVALAAGLAFAVQPGAPAAEAAPTVHVTPADGLSDGAKVELTATGLTPGVLFHVGQCAFVESGEYGCNAKTSVDAVANADGEVRVTLSVNQVFEAVVGEKFEPWGRVDCAVTACQVGLGNGTGEGGGQRVSFR